MKWQLICATHASSDFSSQWFKCIASYVSSGFIPQSSITNVVAATKGTRGPGTQGPEDPRTGDPRTRGPKDPGPKDPRTGDPRTGDPRTRGPGTQRSSSLALSFYDRNATYINVLSPNVRLYRCWSQSPHCYTHS